MFISYNWLRELTGTKLSPEEIRDRLTDVGLTVDAVEERDDDYVLDVEVASNRGDCLSHLGIARELAVIEKSQVQRPTSKVEKTGGSTSEFASVEIRDLDLCPRYAARVIRGVKIGPSPEWLVKKLEAIGQRPINNVADITNYVLHEYGQPLHSFDLAKLAENRIIVRRALTSETITTLDGVERKLDPEMLVIADAKKAVAVAGVMGGEDSEISGATTDVLIESAYFDPASIRRTAKLIGLHTEASHRFERGTDREGVLEAQTRCVSLICEIAGGVATEDAIDVHPVKTLPLLRGAELRVRRVEELTSLQVNSQEMLRILTGLGFIQVQPSVSTAEDERLAFVVPSWRHDVSIEEDLVEEVARHTGYDNIRSELPPAHQAGEYHTTELRKRSLRRALAQLGYNEAINLSFIEATNAFELLPALSSATQVILSNPIIEEASRMRPTLLPGLLNSIRRNLNHGIRDISLFETGRVFASGEPGELPVERDALAIVASGGLIEANRAQASRELDLFDLKGTLEAAVEAINLPPLTFEAAAVKHLQAGQTASVRINETRIGSIGRLSETLSGEYKFRQPVFVAELDLTSLLQARTLPVLYSPLPKFPGIVRDVSLLVERRTTVYELITAGMREDVDNLVAVTFVGAYEGEGIPESQRSVTLRFEYRAADYTMRDEEVDALHWPIIDALRREFNAEVR